MKTIFTNTLAPNERWFNAIQNLKFNGGCQDGEYPRIGWPSLNQPKFKELYYSTNSTTLTQVQFAGGLKVPPPSTPLSPINNSYLSSTLSANQLNVTAPGVWINYRNGVLSCPKRSRVTADVISVTTDSVFGFRSKTWLINYAANAQARNGVSFGSNFFTINGITIEPLTVTVTRSPVALGGAVNTDGFNFLDWQHDSVTNTLRVNLTQGNVPYTYSVTVVF